MPDLNQFIGCDFTEVKEIKTHSKLSVFREYNSEMLNDSIPLRSVVFSVDTMELKEDLEDRISLVDGDKVINDALGAVFENGLDSGEGFDMDIALDKDGAKAKFELKNISNLLGAEKAKALVISKLREEVAACIHAQSSDGDTSYNIEDLVSFYEINIPVTALSIENDGAEKTKFRPLEDATFKADILDLIDKGDEFGSDASDVFEKMVEKINYTRDFDEDLSIHVEYEEGDTEITIIAQGKITEDQLVTFRDGFEENLAKRFSIALCEHYDDLDFDEVYEEMPQPTMDALSDVQVSISNFPVSLKMNAAEVCFETSFIEDSINEFYEDHAISFQTPYQGCDVLEKTAKILTELKNQKWNVSAIYDNDDLDVKFESNEALTLDGATTQEMVLIVDDALNQALAELSNSNELMGQAERNKLVSQFIAKEFPDLDDRIAVEASLRRTYKLESKDWELNSEIGTKTTSSPSAIRPFDASDVTLSDELQIKLDNAKRIAEKVVSHPLVEASSNAPSI